MQFGSQGDEAVIDLIFRVLMGAARWWSQIVCTKALVVFHR